MEGEGVRMADYDPGWPQLFAELRERIARALGGLVIAIEHVGSTSVPNLAAKPIIDVDVVVRREDVAAATAILEQNGYRHEGDLGIKGREAFRWTARVPEHHLYLCPEGSEALERHITVRNYLRAHPEVAREYGELKRQLAAQYRDDRTKYQEAKAEFVEQMFKKAKEIAQKIENHEKDADR